mmetsp:Transcript_8503/g.14309  ORF Transcript_8503/g.14309 Transcript_8503/m.14309 type:complete len:411 (-) Transcript_8503:924-2156(-)
MQVGGQGQQLISRGFQGQQAPVSGAHQLRYGEQQFGAEQGLIRNSFLDRLENELTPPSRDKIIDFLSAVGKIASIMLAVTPLPTYFGVWNKSRQEQVQRVESISFMYILVNILSCSVWTAYAFKTQNIDLAVISVFPLVISIILSSIYLSVKPESRLIKMFFATLFVSQIFNFDSINVPICGLTGTTASILSNMVPLSFMPEVIRTRDVSGINLPLTCINLFNLAIWVSYAILKGDPFMTVSQSLGLVFNSITLMFFLWAKRKINAKDTPSLMVLMDFLIHFFKLFDVQKNLSDMKHFFWLEENSPEAQEYISQYKKEISELHERYADSEDEVTYEEHMSDMRKINCKLQKLKGKDQKAFSDYYSKRESSARSTDGGSSQPSFPPKASAVKSGRRTQLRNRQSYEYTPHG